MNWLLDTNALSEPTKPLPDSGLIAWLSENDEDRMFISSASLAELHFGVQRLPTGKRRDKLHRWLNEELTERFAGRILAIDESVAQAWGILSAQQEAVGHPVGAIDGFLAATALVHDLTLVSRNTADFEGVLPKLLNPWKIME
jgi:predicted nucleic acid-binding protein